MPRWDSRAHPSSRCCLTTHIVSGQSTGTKGQAREPQSACGLLPSEILVLYNRWHLVNYLVSNCLADEWDSAHFSTGKTEVSAIVELMLSIHIHEGLDSTSSTKKEKEEGKEKEKSGHSGSGL